MCYEDKDVKYDDKVTGYDANQLSWPYVVYVVCQAVAGTRMMPPTIGRE